MTDNPFAPLLPWDESIAQAPEWRGGSSDTIVIGPDMTPDRFAVICPQVYDQGFRWAEFERNIFTDDRILVCFTKPK